MAYISLARKECHPKLSDAAARDLMNAYVDMRRLGASKSWLKVPSTLFDDTAPSARLVAPRAQAAPTHLRARPEHLGSSPWPQEPASGHPKVEDLTLSTTRSKRIITATPRQLESLIRLSEAHARMRMSPTVEGRDVEEAVRLMKVAPLVHGGLSYARRSAACAAWRPAAASAARLRPPRRRMLARRPHRWRRSRRPPTPRRAPSTWT